MSVSCQNFHQISLRGASAGPFPLTWGQGNMWESINALGSKSGRLNMSWTFPVSHSVSVPDALARIEACLSQFDIFRVAFAKDRTEQHFKDEASVGVYVRDSPMSEVRTTPFDMHEAPIRIELVNRDGFVIRVRLVLWHLAFDGGAYHPLTRRLSDAIEGRGSTPPALQTETLVKHEQSAASVRKSDAVIDYWARTAARLPPGCGLLSTTSGSYSVIAIRSRAIAIAAQVLAAKSSASASGIVLAALARTIGHHIDQELSAMLLVCNNRMRRNLSDFVGQTIGNGLLLLPDEGPRESFLSYAEAVHSRALSAYSRARYDCIKWRGILADLSKKGDATDLSYYFNDVRIDRTSWEGLEEKIYELRQGVEQETSIQVVEQREMSDASLFANLDSAGQECVVELACNDSRIPPDEATALLAALEESLIEEALAA